MAQRCSTGAQSERPGCRCSAATVCSCTRAQTVPMAATGRSTSWASKSAEGASTGSDAWSSQVATLQTFATSLLPSGASRIPISSWSRGTSSPTIHNLHDLQIDTVSAEYRLPERHREYCRVLITLVLATFCCTVYSYNICVYSVQRISLLSHTLVLHNFKRDNITICNLLYSTCSVLVTPRYR